MYIKKASFPCDRPGYGSTPSIWAVVSMLLVLPKSQQTPRANRWEENVHAPRALWAATSFLYQQLLLTCILKLATNSMFYFSSHLWSCQVTEPSRRTGGRQWVRNIIPFSNSFLPRNAEGLLSSSQEKSKQFKTLPEQKIYWGCVIPAKSREREELLALERSCERFLEVFLDRERETDLGCIQDRFPNASRGIRLGSMTWL